MKLRALFDNEQEILFPNQFVNIKLLRRYDCTTPMIVPSSAIQRGAPGTFVYLVKPDRTVAVQKVKLGPSDGQRIAILSGLQPGESVVIDGTDRLRDGAKVTVSPSEQGGEVAAAPAGRNRRTSRKSSRAAGAAPSERPCATRQARAYRSEPHAGLDPAIHVLATHWRAEDRVDARQAG